LKKRRHVPNAVTRDLLTPKYKDRIDLGEKRKVLHARPQPNRKTIEESIEDIHRRFPKTMAYLKDR
jgi:hypothetical protein